VASHFSVSLSPIKVVQVSTLTVASNQTLSHFVPIDNLRRRYQGYLIISRQYKFMTLSVKSNWTGSENTSSLVRKEIAKRWGEDEAKRYNPFENCLTFNRWLENGYVVRKDEKAIRSFIVIEKKDKKSGTVVERRLKTIYLFYEKQVEPQVA
jgi:hypothetical protein